MVATADPAEIVRAVALGVSRLMTGDLEPAERDRGLDELAGLYATQTDVRHPLAPFGSSVLRSRDEVREHFATSSGAGPRPTRFEPADMVVHRTGDPTQVIFEYSYVIEVEDRSAVVPCITVARVHRGQIVESRDYTDHIGFARVFGSITGLAARLAQQ